MAYWWAQENDVEINIKYHKAVIGWPACTPSKYIQVTPWILICGMRWSSGEASSAHNWQSCSCSKQFGLQPWRLTWNIIMEVWFRSFSFLFMVSKWVICRFRPFIFQGVMSNNYYLLALKILSLSSCLPSYMTSQPSQHLQQAAQQHHQLNQRQEQRNIKIFRLSRIENMKLWFASTSHVTWKDNPVMALFIKMQQSLTGSQGSHDIAQATGSASKLDMSELATIVFGAGTLNHTLVSSVKPCSKCS